MKKKLLAFCAGVMILTACTSTRIVKSWREKGKQVSIDKLTKVLVVALLDNETNSLKAEEQMVQYLDGKGVLSHDYLEESIKKNESAIRAKISKDGFDGAVTMRLLDVDKDLIYTPGTISTYPNYYGNFSGYYLNSQAYSLSPGHYDVTKTFSIEVNIFSIRENKIIWTGLTKTTDPLGVKKMTANIAKVIYNKMVEEGFVSNKKHH